MLTIAGVGAGIVLGALFGMAPVAHAADANEKFEWVNASTIKMTYTQLNGALTKDASVDLKKNDQGKFVAENVNAGNYGSMEAPSVCTYTYTLTPSGNNTSGSVDTKRTSGNFLTPCPDSLAMGNVGIGNAAKADDAGGSTTGDGAEEESASSCKVDGIGWIICPVVGFLGLITDAAQRIVVSMLETQPLNVQAENNPTYQVWSIARNLANVVFVIAFMLIIFSQLTSVGIGNYGIKKMLPRLVVAGILVNVSYWICAIALDLSNIIGASVFELFKETIVKLNPESVGAWSGQSDRYATIVGGVLAGTAVAGATLYLGLTVLLPLLITAASAIILVVVVLTIRQALIIILVVVSPLAFVAFLLPNTENFFSKWKSLFTTMLMMYPAIALIFGGSALASEVIMYSAGSIEGDATKKFLVQTTGAFVAIIPLFITPIVMKTAGGVLNRIGGIVNNADKGMFDRARKGAAGLRESELNRQRLNRMSRAQKALDGNSLGKSGGEGSRRRRLGAFVMSAGATAKKNRSEKLASEKGAADYAEASYFAKRARDEDGFAESITGGDEDRAASLKAGAVSTLDKLDAEDIKNRELLIRSKNDPKELLSGAQEEFQRAVLEGDMVGARASLNIMLNGGSKGVDLAHVALEELEQSDAGHRALHDTTDGSVGSTVRSDISKAGLKGKDAVLNQWSYDSGVPLEARDASGNIIYQKDSSGNFKLDSAGNKIAQTIERKDINGNTMYEMDTQGNFKLDQNGNKIAQVAMRPRTLTEVAADKKVIQSLSDAEAVGQTGGALKRASANNTIGQGQAVSIQGNSSVQGALSEDKRAIFEKAAGGKVGPAATPAPMAPLPPNAGNTMRTNPNVAGTAGWGQTSSGLYVPPSGGSNTVATAAAAAAGAAAGTAAGNAATNRNRQQNQNAPTQPIVVNQSAAPTQQYPQQQQQQQQQWQNRQTSGPAPVVSTAAAAAMGAAFGSAAGTMGNGQTIQIQNADIASPATTPVAAPVTPPSPPNIPTSTSGAAASNTNDYTRYTSQKTDNVTVNQTIINNIESRIQSVGGINKMTTQEIIDGIGKTQNLSGASGTHDKLRREYGRRRGFDGPAQPGGPSGTSSSPFPPNQ